MPDTDEIDLDDLRILGVRTHYFMSAYYAHADEEAPDIVTWWATGEDAKRRQDMRDALETFFREQRGRDSKTDDALKARIRAGVEGLLHDWLVVELDDADAGGKEVVIPIYVGPVDRHVMRQDVYASLKPVIAYPFAPDILADALLAIYDLFRSLIGSAGVALVLMTLVVRGAMMPLSIKNQLSMRQYSRKIAKVKPKLDAIKKKYGNNLKKLREEQAKLYREQGIGFPTGCLMLLIQMPIFFALFSSLRVEYSLRNEAFLWIKDLSGPDKLIDFGGTEINLFVLTVFSINLLPLLMVALSVWQQRMMPKPADEQQAQQMRMMKWLPIIFAVILYNYTAALALYMVLSSAVGIAESRIVRFKDKDATEEAAQAAAAGAWPPAKG
jgi:YidC/Oxa1 family membrane protein insertase